MDPIQFLFSLAVLIMSVVAHEVSHGYVAYALGDPTAKYAGRLTLNPLRHLDVMGSLIVPAVTFLFGGVVFGWAKPVPYNPYNLRGGKWGPALVAAAGPATNISLALIFGLFIRLSLSLPYLHVLPPSFLTIAGLVVLVNIVLAVFNFVPIPPLDGSKMLFALLPYRYSFVQEFLEKNWLVIVFLFVFFLWRLISPLVFIIFYLITGTGF